MTEKGCDNCYYTYFDEKAYPCSLCIRGIERTDQWQPSKKTKAEAQTEVKVEPTWEGLTYGRFEAEPQTDIGTSDTVYSDTAGYVPRADMTDCSWK